MQALTISANGLSEWIPVPPGLSKVWVAFPSGASGTVKPKATHKPGDADYVFPIEQGGVEVVATSNMVFDVNGLAFVAFDVSGLSGSIEVLFTSAEPVR